MQTELLFGFAFWGFLIVYGVATYAVSPQARTLSALFAGSDEQGRAASEWALMLSIFISWTLAKSITSAANLGALRRDLAGRLSRRRLLPPPYRRGARVHDRPGARPRAGDGLPPRGCVRSARTHRPLPGSRCPAARD